MDTSCGTTLDDISDHVKNALYLKIKCQQELTK